MKKNQLSLPLGMLALLTVLSLLTGCFKAAAPDVADTPAAGAQVDEQQEETPDVVASAVAESTRVAQTAEETQTNVTPTATPVPPTPTASPPPTTVPITAVPTYTPTPAPPAQTPVPTGQVEHTVQPGENLFRIALRYGTTVQAIANANGIANPAMIYVGQVLAVPSSGSQPPAAGGTTYVVQPGDNLFRIALRYNLSYMYLAQYNNIANPSNIRVGQVIRIP